MLGVTALDLFLSKCIATYIHIVTLILQDYSQHLQEIKFFAFLLVELIEVFFRAEVNHFKVGVLSTSILNTLDAVVRLKNYCEFWTLYLV